jgi:hypothetical protein
MMFMSSVNIGLVEYELDCKDKKRRWRVDIGQGRETIVETIIGTNILQGWEHNLYLLCTIIELVMLGF